MTQPEIEALLELSRIGRLCMASADGRPYSIPLPFCWVNGSLYLRLPLTGRKGQLLRHNDHVCFGVDQYTDTLDDYASVLIEGRLVAVEYLAEKAEVHAMNTRKYETLRQGHRPGHGRSTPLAQLPLRKIVVEQISGRRKSPETSAALASV
jgi:nitroimidazol reductase NimA-like FMN-containing flavoprotein (pyridoxamine 5'-phosphate oxidase superfamily)